MMITLEFNKEEELSTSVTANIAPKLCSDFQKYSISKDDVSKESIRLDSILQPLHHAMFVESNPSPLNMLQNY